MTRPTRPERPGAGNRPQRPARPAGPSGASPTGAARGRALAKTRTSPISTFGALGVVAVILLAGLGYGFSTRNQDKTGISERTSRTLPVGSATEVCQGQLGAGADTSTSLTAFTPAGNAATGADNAGVQYVDGKAFAPLKVGPAGTRSASPQVTQFNSTPDQYGLTRPVPLVFQATGSYAPGFTSDEVVRSDSGLERGLAAGPCVTPSTDFWFAGVSVGTGDRDSFLYLANTDTAPATVNLTFYGQDGKIDTGTVGHDITVLPKAFQEYLLSSALGPAAQASAVASVHVTTTEGRVAAQVRDVDKPQQSDVKNGRGMDFIPAQPPAVAAQTTQTIPGIPAPGKTLTKFDLVITATSNVPVSIDHVYWYGKSGRIELAGQTTDPGRGYTERASPLSIDPNKTVILNMLTDDRDSTEAAALQIVGSGGSFVSGVRLVEAQGGSQDSAYLAPVPPVSSQAIVADNNVSANGGAARSTLILTAAGGKGATVQVTTIDANNKSATATVPIPANSTVPYVPQVTGWFTAIVQPQPGSDPVYGARVLSDLPKGGMQVTAQMLEDARVSAAVPPVAPDLSGAVAR